MKAEMLTYAAVALLFFSAGPERTSAQVGSAAKTGAIANGSLIDGQNKTVGDVRLQQTPHGVLLKVNLTDATAGVHALHIHKVGRCDAPSFDSAGEHFDTATRKHGFLNAAGPHAGDLPNLDIPSSKKLSIEYLLANVTLDAGPTSLLDADGSAVVVHAGKDDYSSDPAGESGDRIACARISNSGQR